MPNVSGKHTAGREMERARERERAGAQRWDSLCIMTYMKQSDLKKGKAAIFKEGPRPGRCSFECAVVMGWGPMTMVAEDADACLMGERKDS